MLKKKKKKKLTPQLYKFFVEERHFSEHKDDLFKKVLQQQAPLVLNYNRVYVVFIYFNCIVTRGGVYDEILPEPE